MKEHGIVITLVLIIVLLLVALWDVEMKIRKLPQRGAEYHTALTDANEMLQRAGYFMYFKKDQRGQLHLRIKK